MEKVQQIILLFYVIAVIYFVRGSGENDIEHNGRFKRYLSFGNISHFFVRLNTKTNSVAWNQIFAQTLGFRMNWDEPPDSFHPYHHLVRRTVYSNMETLLDRNGLNGYHCVRRAICEVRSIKDPKGIYHKILTMIFSFKRVANLCQDVTVDFGQYPRYPPPLDPVFHHHQAAPRPGQAGGTRFIGSQH